MKHAELLTWAALFKATLVLGALHAFWPQTPCIAEDADVEQLKKKVAVLGESNALLRRRTLWLGSLIRGCTYGGTSYTVGGSDPHSERTRLELIEIPNGPSQDEVRVYVGMTLGVTMTRDFFSDADPAVRQLELVGSDNVEVLIEALSLPIPNDSYVVEALKSLAQDRHKALILDNLRTQASLIGVVIARGWVTDAAPILLTVVKQRNALLDTAWIEAAATVARPEHNQDLLWHTLNGVNPYPVWCAVRGLRGMSPLLAEVVPRAWAALPQSGVDDYHRCEIARIAAHYGILDALGVVAVEASSSGQDIDVFRELTGYKGEQSKASQWFQAHKERLRFNAKAERYTVGP